MSLRQERRDRFRYLSRVGLQREMPCVEKPDFRVGQVAPERLCTRRKEEGIVLSPDRQQGRPMLA